jgi:hypothetical protein
VRDVEITRLAVLELLALIDAEQLGPWRVTGAGQSHAAWRRRFLRERPLVHDEQDALAAERRALWTGRCEAWRWGRLEQGPFHEYDLELAYPHIAAEVTLPHAIVGRVGELPASRLPALLRRYAVLADVEVRTDLPLVPAAAGALIHWPVGRFETMLWGPELEQLLGYGAEVKVRRGWLYSRSAALAHFSRWLLEQLHDVGGSTTAVQRRALKHMSRTLIGRFALRYQGWEHYGQLADFGLRLGVLHDVGNGSTVETLHVGHQYLTLGAETEGEDTLPQITGWVMAEARRRLWDLMVRAGLANVAYLDTDSLIVNDAGAAELERLIGAGRAYSLRRKATYRRLEIFGPRQLLPGRQRRVSGVPLAAWRAGPRSFEGETWRGLRESIARGEGETVVLEHKRWQLTAVDNRRSHLAGGSTAPHVVGLADG